MEQAIRDAALTIGVIGLGLIAVIAFGLQILDRTLERVIQRLDLIATRPK